MAEENVAPAESACAKCGGSGEIEIGCAMDHALTAPCVECRGTGIIVTTPPESTRVAGEQRLLTPEEIADIERFQQQRRRSPVAADAWLYVAEIDRLLAHIRLGREQLENEIFQDATDPNFAAAPADNDAREVCRLLSTLDWVVGYELVTENQLILDRAQELALKVMGMSNPPTPPTKGDR